MSIALFERVSLATVQRILVAGLPGERIEVAADAADPTDVDIAVVGAPTRGALARFSNLRLIVSLWAGVDHLVADPTRPKDAIITRLVDENLTTTMVEAALAHVLAAHRQHDVYRRAQGDQHWSPQPQSYAPARTVAVLGVGTLGTAVAQAIARVGFRVVAWNRSPREVEGIVVRSGTEGLPAVLREADILVNLLALTPETHGILRKETLSLLPEGAVVINLARGAHLVEADLFELLDRGHLRHAVLDVHATEPLPREHPAWRHPRIDVFPHVAAQTDPASAAQRAVETILAFRAGLPLPNAL
ncbi:glyoxylate/hydroxypyruvate reductase A [Pendulispora rubella]|uniref:Glyoxylate/hydroxypyruvate reductase A n=1 Tax=Pendulispora rubella TaxID=2741070 RepID=A0ABZ2L4Z5_9BACT